MWFPSRHRVCNRRVYRGLLCALLLLGHAVSAIGYQSFASIGTSREKHCACPLPEQVWGSCCCISSHEEPLETATPAVSQSTETPVPSCCVKRAQRSCCEPLKQPAETKPVPKGLRWLASLSAAHCQSEEPMGLIAAEPVISERTAADLFVQPARTGSLRIGSEFHFSHPLVPPTRPPRLG